MRVFIWPSVMNISKKLKLSFASAIALPLFIIAALVITQTRDQALDNFAQMSEREARQIDNGIAMFFSEIEITALCSK